MQLMTYKKTMTDAAIIGMDTCASSNQRKVEKDSMLQTLGTKGKHHPVTVACGTSSRSGSTSRTKFSTRRTTTRCPTGRFEDATASQISSWINTFPAGVSG